MDARSDDHAPEGVLDAAAVRRTARRLYVGGSPIPRLIQHHRVRICPIDRVAAWVGAGSRVLDVGCGGGLLLLVLAEHGRIARGVGIDAGAAAIDAARAANARLPGSPIVFECRSVEDGLPGGGFDTLCLVDVMHHIAPGQQRGAFEAVARRVPPGGRLVYKDMVRRPRWRAAANRLHDLVMARQWIRYVPIDAVEGWAAEAGLRCLHRERIDRLWYGHELRVFERSEA